MPFESSVFQREVKEIIDAGIKSVFFRWEATLHANGRDLEAYYVDNVELNRNYLKNSFDEMFVTINVPPGNFEKYFVPYKDSLEITLRRIPLSEAGNMPTDNAAVASYRYRATLENGASGVVAGKDPSLQNITAANNANVKAVTLQLMDPVVEQVRLKTIGTIFRNTNAANAIRVALGKYGKSIKNAEKEVAIKGVDVAPNYIEEVRDHIVIPHMTKLVSFPDYIHQFHGGVYNGGFGYYLQEGLWYLYPPFDVTRYPKSKKTLTVLNVPAERFPQPERSHRVTPTQVIILATGDVKHVDETESQQLNAGNGVRFADANRLFTQFAQTGGNKAIASRGDNTAEFVYENRPTKVNNAQASPDKITDNYALERGRIASRAGSYIQLIWEASDPSLLQPGMPVKLMYLENDRSQEIYGCLIGAHTHNDPINQGVKERKFMSKTVITLFIDRKVKVDDPDYAK